MVAKRFELTLFWRTFIFLVALLTAGAFAWVQVFLALESEPEVVLAARQIVSLVGVTREAIQHADRRNLDALLRDLGQQQALTVRPRQPTDRTVPFEADGFARNVTDAVRAMLADVRLAGAVNGAAGLWVGFTVAGEPWWLRTDSELVRPPRSPAWVAWALVALAITIIGSGLIARRLNAPLRELQFATTRIKEGEFESRLDESALTSEIREVNRGFNRMARELAKVEEDRAVMLAGISHDLRTPLARLRLEAEMSVTDDEARKAMAADIDQLDAIIGKFMDYARPGETHLESIGLAEIVEKEAAAFREPAEIRITHRLGADMRVLADAVELARVLANLFENARRYGRTTDTGIASVSVSANRAGEWWICTVRDRGPGVADERLAQLSTPFFRGDAARTAATGAGLGLAIVEKSMSRMGGDVEFHNAPDGGLMVHLRLKAA